MEAITTVAGLKNAIRILEIEQDEKEKLLKLQFKTAYEDLRPVNIIKNTLKDWMSPNYLDLNRRITETTIGALSGYILRKVLVGSSNSIVRSIMAKLFQLGVTKAAVLKSHDITSAAIALISKLFSKKAKDPEVESE